MITSISKKLKSYFNNIEFTAKGKELAIKPIDKIASWDNFENDLFLLVENIQIDNIKNLTPLFISYRDKQEKEFKNLLSLKNHLIENNFSLESIDDYKHFIVSIYPHNSDLKIINWKLANELAITEAFVDDFNSLMNFRLGYAFKIVEKLESISNVESQPNIKNSIVSSIPPKGYDEIFPSIELWIVFMKLVEVIVNSKPKSHNWATFSVIFQTLIDKKLVRKHKHRVFLDYCDKNHNTDFTVQKKLKSNTSNHATELIIGYLEDANLLNN